MVEAMPSMRGSCSLSLQADIVPNERLKGRTFELQGLSLFQSLSVRTERHRENKAKKKRKGDGREARNKGGGRGDEGYIEGNKKSGEGVQLRRGEEGRLGRRSAREKERS